MNFCPKCRKKLVVPDFCVECGADLSEYLNPSDSASSPSGSLSSFDFSHLAAEAEAQLAEQEKLKDFEISNGELTAYQGMGGRVVIPREVTSFSRYGYPFKGNTSITEIVFEGTVSEIPSHAFEDCTGLKSIVIPEGTTKIGNGVFEGCTNLRQVTIPTSVREIGEGVFKGCAALEELQFNAEYATLTEEHNNRVFDGAGTRGNGIKVQFGAKVRHVPDYLFFLMPPDFCPLSSVTFEGNGCESIGTWAFSNCKKLTGVWIPDSVRKIGQRAFDGCENLKNVRLPENITALEDNVFDSCVELRSISIPRQVTSIGKEAFYACGFTSIVLPDQLTRLGENVFMNCPNLESITIPDGVSRIERGTFGWCKRLRTVNLPRNLAVMENSAFERCERLESITIPSNVIEYNPHAFIECDNLRVVRIPSKFSSSQSISLSKVVYPKRQIVFY